MHFNLQGSPQLLERAAGCELTSIGGGLHAARAKIMPTGKRVLRGEWQTNARAASLMSCLIILLPYHLVFNHYTDV